MPLEPFDLERLATAAYLTGRDAESTDTWTRAHQMWQERGELQRAVHAAFWLGFGLVQRGEMAQGGGWLARAGRLVEEHGLDSVECGYLLVPQALMALGEGQPDAALERFGEADSLARRFGDRDLATLGLLGRGQALMQLGRTSDGLRVWDEAMVAVTAGETSPVISGLVYCAVIDGCQQVFDLRRVREWTAALDRWCNQQPGLVPYRGQCVVHRAQVLQVVGQWTEALTELEQARDRLSDPPHPAVGMAHYQLGELHRLRGEHQEAEDAYRQAHASGRDPQPGLALLRLAEGRIDTSAAAISAALDAASGDAIVRAQLLPAYVEVMLAADRQADAAVAAHELEQLAVAAASTMLRTIAAQTRGSVLLAGGDAKTALGPLRDALEAWQELDAPYEVAQVRVLIAAACHQLDDSDRAALECDAARVVFDALGAASALARLEELASSQTDTARSSTVEGRAVTITDRERDVLRLVAAGHTNKSIAAELAISEKTVERHLGNIFTKLDVSNRAAATAHAYDHGLL
ncbi:MAG: LuxR C-terminal-related transcriptional regulator [Acidimicrobiales bacterium]|nr:LuxR C-terminal-related transcriptional regulator [Acidimicrobiales bacterium]